MEFAGTDRFSLLAKLGEGGMGIVYDAHDRIRDMRVALKTLRHAKPAHLYRFKREFRTLSALSHPNIVTLYELLSEGGHWFFTMELIEGVDVLTHARAGRAGPPWQKAGAALARLTGPAPFTDELETRTSEVLGDAPGRDSVLAMVLGVAPEVRVDIADMVDVDELRRVLGQLAGALDALHAAGLVHRDLKPSNVRVTGDGRAVLMDFGIVAEVGARGAMAAADRDGLVMGTPSYMAPEQVEGGDATPATDWYAFGVLLYNALCGRLPFQGTAAQVMSAKKERTPLPPSAFVSGVPEDLQRLCMALLARDPAARPGGAAVLAALGADQGETRPDTGLVREPTSASHMFVGRTDALADLDAAYAAAQRRGMQCAVVRGPSGMGKTRLVEHFVEQLQGHAAPPVVLAGRCHERESLPYKAFDGVIDSLCHYLLGLDPRQRQALLPEGTEALARLFPVLLQVIPGAVLATLAGRDPHDVRVQAMEALGALLTALAQERPAIVYIEDLQWADASSVDLLRYLLHSSPPAGLLLVITLRSECVDSSPQVAAAMDALVQQDFCHFIDLGPLSEAEQRELLARLSQSRDLRALIDDQLCAESAGHPMLLVELGRYLHDVDVPVTAGDRLHLEDVIWRRVSLLSRPARALMETIAVAGEPLPLHVLAAAAGLSGTDSERAAASLCAAHLARVARTANEPWLDRFHIKVSESIMERLPAERVCFLHMQLAHALESWVDAPVATMAHHWLAAGDRPQAALYLIEAGHAAAHQLAFDRAADLYRAGLALLPEATGSPRLDRACCRAWIGLAEAMRVIDRDDEALALLDRAEELAMEYQLAEELAQLHYLRGALLFVVGDLSGCLAANQRSYSFAIKARSAQHKAQALSGLGDAHYMHGHMLTAYAYFDRSVEVCREHGFSSIEAANLSMRGLTHYFQNNFEQALRDGLAAAALATRIGHSRAEMVARSTCIGWVLIEMGHLDQAQSEYEQALTLAHTIGARRFEPLCLTGLARIAALRDLRHHDLRHHDLRAPDLRNQAQDLARQAVATSRAQGPAFVGPMALGALALATADPDTQLRVLTVGEEVLQSGVVGHNHLHFYRDAMDAVLGAGRLELVEHYAAQLERYTASEPLPWSRFLIERARALVDHMRGLDNREQLLRLCEQARRAGLHNALHALDQATELAYERNTAFR